MSLCRHKLKSDLKLGYSWGHIQRKCFFIIYTCILFSVKSFKKWLTCTTSISNWLHKIVLENWYSNFRVVSDPAFQSLTRKLRTPDSVLDARVSKKSSHLNIDRKTTSTSLSTSISSIVFQQEISDSDPSTLRGNFLIIFWWKSELLPEIFIYIQYPMKMNKFSIFRFLRNLTFKAAVKMQSHTSLYVRQIFS